jgi:hypothetical protein
MAAQTPSDIKKWLLSAGFEVYRTLGNRVLVADRVRDNLIMDSSVSVGASPGMFVQIVLRALHSDFPQETEEQLFSRARALAGAPLERGYREVGVEAVPIRDPGDRSQVLDTWFEVSFARDVADEAELTEELRYALALPKTAVRVRT